MMKIRRLTLENFRKFRSPVRVAGFGDGLNVICEPNEFGKSTLLEAMRAALFERYAAKTEQVRSFRPWGDETAPAVELCFDLEGTSWTIAKRFLQSPRAVLTGPDGQTYTSDHAEERLQQLLGFEWAGNRSADAETRGVLGMLWIEQGDALRLAPPGRIARETIQSVLAGEVGAVTGGRRAAAVSAAIEGGYREYRTPGTGQPTGRLLEVQRQHQTAQARVAEAAETLRRFGETLDRLQAARLDLVRVEREQNAPQYSEEITALRRDLEIARTAESRWREARAVLGEAAGRREAIEQRAAERTSVKAEQGEARRSLTTARNAVEAFKEQFARAQAVEADLSTRLGDARKSMEAAQGEFSKARRVLAEAQEAVVFGRARGRLQRAEEIAARAGLLEAEVEGLHVSEKDLARLLTLETSEAHARTAIEMGAVALSIKLVREGDERVRIDGSAAKSGRMSVLRPVVVEVDGVGTLTVEPPAVGGAAVQVAHRRAKEDLEAALSALHVSTMSEARTIFERRRKLMADLEVERARLESTCPPDEELRIPAGLDALRGVFVGKPRPEAAGSDLDQLTSTLAEADLKLQRATADHESAREARDAAASSLRETELQQVKLVTAVEDAKARLDRAEAAYMAGISVTSDDGLAEDLVKAKETEARALAAVEEAQRAAQAFKPDELLRRLQHHDIRQRNLAEERTRLAGEVGRLEQLVLIEGEKGPAAEADEAKAQLANTQEDLEAATLEADALTLLRQVLSEAAREAARTYLEPVTRRMSPYLSRLLPDAALELSEAMSPSGVNRGGHVEPAQSLSRGTQEQLAVLTRIAFADLLIEKRKPVSLVLDDALVFSDDARLEVMTDIISDVAERMQVILMTCRKRAFLHLDAPRLAVEASAPISI